MPIEFTRPTSVAIPSQSAIAYMYKSTNLADAFSIQLPAGASADPDLLARFIFSQQAPWVIALMKVRDALVAGFGLKTTEHLASLADGKGRNRIGIFKVYGTTEHEIVLGEDDKHLDFRVSVLCHKGLTSNAPRRVVVSTVVHCHNRLGRIYILLIAPFHRLVVQSNISRAARSGWPAIADV